MSRRIALMMALLTLPSAGCSLVWTPVIADGGPDAYVEPPDGGPDAWAPDASTPPREICSVSSGGTEMPEGRDNDGDDLIDCADPDCFGTAVCCTDGTGVDLGGSYTPPDPPEGWQLRDTVIDVGSAGGRVLLDFGTAGHVRRTSCAPLAAGARLDLDLFRTVQDGDLSIVLSPSGAPSADGYLDELALRFSSTAGFSVTRAGDRQVLAELPACPMQRAADGRQYDLPLPSRVVVQMRPGVAGSGVSALLVTVEVFGSFGACSSVRPVVDFPIDVRDLVRTTGGLPESCDENPGLYVVVEGHGAAFEVGRSVRLQRYECASPAVFSVDRPILGRASLSATIPATEDDFATGGIGAPDLDLEGGVWRLAYDGSEEDRSSEVFRTLTTRIGMSTSGSFLGWRGVPTDDGAPLDTGPSSVREPALLYEGVNTVVFARARAAGGFDLYRADSMADGVLSGVSLLAGPLDSRCSYREPALAPAHPTNPDRWIFFRCDIGASSTLGAILDTETEPPQVVSMDLLADASPGIARRVRALDVVTQSAGGDRSFAVWVLADTDGGGPRALHLLAGQAVEGTLPTLVPYAGNPVLTASDLTEGCTGACELTSFGVGVQRRPGSDLLRFLFARSRSEAAAGVYELVPRTQIAPSTVSDGD